MSGATGTIEGEASGTASGTASTAGTRRPFQWPIAAFIAALFLALIAGFALASWRAGPHVTTGRADTAADGGGSIITPDWTYGFPAGVDWMDSRGVWHTGGETPECLSTDRSVMVRFASVEVTIDGTTWRPVVWIDCRGAAEYAP
jgi:hypothetical protein